MDHNFSNFQKRKNFLTFQVYTGILTPLFFLVFIIVLGFIKPDYDINRMTISYLGAGNSFISFLSSFLFVVTGTLIIFFSLGLNSVLKEKHKINTAFFIIMFSFFDLVVSGFFPTDLANKPLSITGLIHFIGSCIGDFFLLISFYVFFTSDAEIINSKHGKYFSLFTLLFSLISISITIGFHFISPLDFPFGLIQKIEFTIICLFLSFLSLELFKYLRETKE